MSKKTLSHVVRECKYHVVLVPKYRNEVFGKEVGEAGWTHSDTARLADRIPGGKTCRVLRKVARWHKVYICCGLAEKDGGQVYIFAVYRV